MVIGSCGCSACGRNNELGAFGELQAHFAMLGKGYEPLGNTDGIYHAGLQGIDGIYKNPRPLPDYIITEAKYNTATLNKKTGQMSDKWVLGKNRLQKKVGKEEERKIKKAICREDGSVEKWLLHIEEDGKVNARLIVDVEGNATLPKDGLIPGFPVPPIEIKEL